MSLIEDAKRCKDASFAIMNASTTEKNNILSHIAQVLDNHRKEILEQNQLDMQQAQAHGMSEQLLDRMMLNDERIDAILSGIQTVIALPDPIGEITQMKTLPDGLQIGKMRVALGVVGMIYEARPNVTVDAAILCIKSGNSVMLRGSKDIFHTNRKLVELMQKALIQCQFPKETISFVEDTNHETAAQFMKMHEYLDVLIPRGSAKLIRSTVEKASVPVLETGSGNCHIYIDDEADLDKAMEIIINAKTSRTSVCNACESVLIHKDVDSDFILMLIHHLLQLGVAIHADPFLCAYDERCQLATQEDYYKEYLGMEISMKQVVDLEEAIYHINRYSTHHSETIVSENYTNIKQFLREVDSACVYANASTRFSDGFEFGFGAEIGISTQKLHARGPMGLEALTSQKYIILGDGQIR
ncbi:glutamate-5-semialdehyde dehydrogenase [Amedibacillus dolichus]|uniref:glutamate-5-semialdehyde dehydrogenase n=1 Tax=Amedibacillus dolichus TaxID=31971 RepID=UPI001EDA3698|nr:glutamate-5-semialdehyde dehydrogenase [Amedibacillus dolichus]MCG4879009.1 glutamate-5-semialdehyde dehydrogenase [Amedibacillus dolichus]